MNERDLSTYKRAPAKSLTEQLIELSAWENAGRNMNDMNAVRWCMAEKARIRAELKDTTRPAYKRAVSALKRATTLAEKTGTTAAWRAVDRARAKLESIYQPNLV